jgi:hypothetical protein
MKSPRGVILLLMEHTLWWRKEFSGPPLTAFRRARHIKKSQDPLIEKRRIKKTLLLMDDAADNYIRVMLKRAWLMLLQMVLAEYVHWKCSQKLLNAYAVGFSVNGTHLRAGAQHC